MTHRAGRRGPWHAALLVQEEHSGSDRCSVMGEGRGEGRGGEGRGGEGEGRGGEGEEYQCNSHQGIHPVSCLHCKLLYTYDKTSLKNATYQLAN